MKKQIALFLFITCFATGLKAQKLVEDKTDEFTKTYVKRTDWCPLHKKKGSARPHRSYFRISKLNDDVYFDLMMMLNNQVYSIKEGDQIMFLFEDKSVVTISNLKHTVSEIGGGTDQYGGSANYGTTTSYKLSKEDIEKLSKGWITKFRIYTSLGYSEFEEDYNLNPHLKKCLELVGS